MKLLKHNYHKNERRLSLYHNYHNNYNMTYAIHFQIGTAYTPRQKYLIYQINRLLSGNSKCDKLIKASTLIKNDLGYLLDIPEVQPAIRILTGRIQRPRVRKNAVVEPVVVEDVMEIIEEVAEIVEEIVEEPSFSKQDMIDWVPVYYTNKASVKLYLNVLQDKAKRLINIPDFKNSVLELNDEFFEIIKPSTYIKSFINLMMRYLRERKFTAVKFYAELMIRMDLIRNRFNDIKLLENSKKKTEVLPINLEDMKEMFEVLYNKVQNNESYYEKNLNYAKVINSAIIVGLYTQHAYRDDIGNIQINPDMIDDKMNYYKDGKIVVSEHKTSKTYGVLTMELDSRVIELIELSLTRNPRDFLFTGANGKISQKITSVFSNLFGKHLTINIIRRVHTSEAHTQSSDVAIETANKMGHSVKTSMWYERGVKPSSQ